MFWWRKFPFPRVYSYSPFDSLREPKKFFNRGWSLRKELSINDIWSETILVLSSVVNLIVYVSFYFTKKSETKPYLTMVHTWIDTNDFNKSPKSQSLLPCKELINYLNTKYLSFKILATRRRNLQELGLNTKWHSVTYPKFSYSETYSD